MYLTPRWRANSKVESLPNGYSQSSKTVAEMRPKSVRKVLGDISNRDGHKQSKSKTPAKERKEESVMAAAKDKDGALDRLLLVQSDLSALISQIDELVVQAFQLKETGENGKAEIESFSHVLSEIISSLKPWVSRFKKTVSDSSVVPKNDLGILASKDVDATEEVTESSVDSPEETKSEETLISPSPLVSWRGDCTIERGRQLFLLTPLPMTKTRGPRSRAPSKTVLDGMISNHTESLPSLLAGCRDANGDLLEGLRMETMPSKFTDSTLNKVGSTVKHGASPTPKFSSKDCSIIFLTPRLNISPPKSCVLLEPISESSHKGNDRLRKCTPFPRHCSSLQISECSDSESSDEGLAFKYPELLGLQRYKSGIRRKEIAASPDWFLSPPKTCVLLEPPDEKSLKNSETNDPLSKTVPNLNQQAYPSFPEEISGQAAGCQQARPSLFEGLATTPQVRVEESVMRAGRRPGENTLKKELWTKFEAASTNPIRFNVPLPQPSQKKGFLELLDEVSCEKEI